MLPRLEAPCCDKFSCSCCRNPCSETLPALPEDAPVLPEVALAVPLAPLRLVALLLLTPKSCISELNDVCSVDRFALALLLDELPVVEAPALLPSFSSLINELILLCMPP